MRLKIASLSLCLIGGRVIVASLPKGFLIQTEQKILSLRPGTRLMLVISVTPISCPLFTRERVDFNAVQFPTSFASWMSRPAAQDFSAPYFFTCYVIASSNLFKFACACNFLNFGYDCAISGGGRGGCVFMLRWSWFCEVMWEVNVSRWEHGECVRVSVFMCVSYKMRDMCK